MAAEMVEMLPVVTDADVEAVAALARVIWMQHYVPIIGGEQVDYMLRTRQSPNAIRQHIDAGADYYRVRSHDRDAGYFAMVPERESGRVMLSKIYIERSRRGGGLGRAIIRDAEDYGRQRDMHTLWLTVNKHNDGAIAFYKLMGFRIVRKVVDDIGNGFVMDDYVMEKPL